MGVVAPGEKNLRNISTIYIYNITRLASYKIFSPSNKIHREVGRAKDLSAPMYHLAMFHIRLPPYLLHPSLLLSKLHEHNNELIMSWCSVGVRVQENVNLSFSILSRHEGGEEVQVHSFFTVVLDGRD